MKQKFGQVRILIRKYAENVEVVDPQLKNNGELVEVLTEFEKAWSLAKEFFCDEKKFKNLLWFSQIIEGLGEKHKQF